MAQVSAAQTNYLTSQLIEIAKFDSRKDKITVLDDTSETNITYVGVAIRPANAADAVWEIRKIDESSTDVSYTDSSLIITTADPKSVWDDRLIISYK